jgi:hypothetical protein
MKNIFLMAVATVFVFAVGCEKNTENKNYDNTLPGTWKEFQYLADPGDGSGKWQSGNGLTVQVNNDLTYVTNNENSFWGKSGKITVLSDSTFTLNRPQTNSEIELRYKFIDGVMEVHYLCIEPCGSRFRKDTN